MKQVALILGIFDMIDRLYNLISKILSSSKIPLTAEERERVIARRQKAELRHSKIMDRIRSGG